MTIAVDWDVTNQTKHLCIYNVGRYKALLVQSHTAESFDILCQTFIKIFKLWVCGKKKRRFGGHMFYIHK